MVPTALVPAARIDGELVWESSKILEVCDVRWLTFAFSLAPDAWGSNKLFWTLRLKLLFGVSLVRESQTTPPRFETVANKNMDAFQNPT